MAILHETEEHKKLKEKATGFLKGLGFTSITDEYPTGVIYSCYAIGSREAWVDVVGIDGDRMILVECGDTPWGKLRTLSRHFDEVYHLPYGGEIKRVERVPKEYWWETE